MTAARLGIDRQPPTRSRPSSRTACPTAPLDEVLAGIAWPPEVDGCAVTQEIVILPPAAEAELADADGQRAARGRRTRTGARPGWSSACCATAAARRCCALRGERGRRLTGPDLAPNLVAALLATLH